MSHIAMNDQAELATSRNGEQFWPDINGHAFARTESRVIYDQNFRTRLVEQDRLNLMLGTDSGLLLRYVRALTPPEGSRYLFIELPVVIERLRKASLLDDLPPHIAVVELQDAPRAAAAFGLMRYAMRREIRTFESLAAQEAVCRDYLRLRDEVRTWLQPIQLKANILTTQAPFMVRQMENLGESIVPAQELAGCWLGKPAVIMAGGPSLDALLPWIVANRDALLVIAVSRISRLLVERQIVPDIVVSVDPHPISFDVSREMLNFPESTIFAYTYHATPMLVGQWPWQSVFMGPRLPWQSARNVSNLLPTGETVTNHAADLAMLLGCREILLAGVDLCYATSGQSHASGSHESEAGPLINASSLVIATNDGREASTDGPFRAAADDLARKAAAGRERGIRFVNLAPSAARIEGIDFVPADRLELPATDADTRAAGSLHARLPAPDRELRQAHLADMRSDIAQAFDEIGRLRELCREGLACCDGVSRNEDRRERARDDVIARIKKLPMVLADVLQRYRMAEFARFMAVEDPNALSAQARNEVIRSYFDALLVAADKFEPLLKSADDRLVSRQDEESDQPDYPALLKRWSDEHQPARAANLLRRRPELATTLDADTAEGFEQMATAYDEMMSSTDTGRTAVIKQRRNPLLSRPKAQQLLQGQNRDGLRALLDSLGQYPESPHRQAMMTLVEGMIAELAEDDAAALDCYQRIVDSGHKVLGEDALLRISVIGLRHKDLDLAGIAFQALSERMPRYKLQHAEILRIQGRLQDAVNVLTQYIEHRPNDRIALLRLADLYEGMGQTDAAAEIRAMPASSGEPTRH